MVRTGVVRANGKFQGSISEVQEPRWNAENLRLWYTVRRPRTVASCPLALDQWRRICFIGARGGMVRELEPLSQ